MSLAVVLAVEKGVEGMGETVKDNVIDFEMTRRRLRPRFIELTGHNGETIYGKIISPTLEEWEEFIADCRKAFPLKSE